MLPHTQLGKTDICISRLGLGTVKFGRNQGVKYPEAFELPSDELVRSLLHKARDLGINLVDTAAAYGSSEERLGYHLRNDRKQWVICSKAGEQFNGIESHFDFSPDALRKSLERSLRKLRTDYLDVFLIHSDGNDSDIIHRDQALHTLAQLKQEGWIRAYGMSVKTLEGGLICAREADVVMTTFTPESEADLRLLDECLAQHTGVLLKKIFQNGHLLATDNPLQTSVLRKVEDKMAAIFSHKAVNSAIIGTINSQHLQSNATCALEATL